MLVPPSVLRPALALAVAASSMGAQEPLADPADPIATLTRARLRGEGATPHVRAALGDLARLGPRATAALPELREWLAGPVAPAARAPLLDAVAAIGPYAPGQRTAIVAALSAFGRHNQPCCDPEFLRAASRLAVDPGQPTAGLIAGLADPDPFVREFCAELVGRRGAEARAAAPLLAAGLLETQPGHVSFAGRGWMTAVVGDFDHYVHAQMAEALLRVAPDALAAAPAWRYRLGHGRSNERVDAAIALGLLGPDAAFAVEALCLALTDPDPRVVREAVTALGAIGPPARGAESLLQELERHEDPGIARCAAAALRALRE